MKKGPSLVFVLAILVCGSVWSKPIDLSSLDFFVRPGFDLSWTFHEPEPGDPAWTRVPARTGNRPIIIRDIGLPGRSKPSLIRFRPRKPEKFCVLTAFDAGQELLESSSGVGLYLAQVGENWEIYLNGSIVRSEVFLRKDGRIERERAFRGALVNMDKRYLRPGRNVLAVMIVGDPDSERSGFFAGSPYLIDSYQRLLGLKVEYFDLMLIGIYVFFALYHVLLFGLRPSNKPYLFYALGTLVLSGFLLTQTFVIFDLVPDSAFVNNLALSCIFMLFPIFLGFFDELNRGRVSLFTRIYGAICLASAIVSVFILHEALFLFWQLTVVLPILYLVIFDFALPLGSSWKRIRAGLKGEGPLPDLEAIGSVIFHTDLGKLVFGSIVVIVTVVLDIVNMNRGSDLALTKYAFIVLVFGIATVLAGQYHRVYDEIEEMAVSLERKVKDRTSELETANREQSLLNERISGANLKLQNAMDVAAKDMRMAVQVQQGLLPAKAPQTVDWDIAFAFHPASGVSGDFYDFYTAGDRLKGLVVGDVSGHGIASGLITVLARGVVWRSFTSLSGNSLGRILEQSNAELSKELSSVENFLTCILLRMDGGSVEYANAGHSELAFRRAGKARANLLQPSSTDDYKGPPLGREGIDALYKAVKFDLNPGDSLFIYTDGLFETRDDQGKPFGMDGLLTAYGRAPEGSAADMLKYVIDDWRFHMGEEKAADDMTAVIARKR